MPLKHATTVQLRSHQDLDLMVQEYTNHDNTKLARLGKHCKEVTWKIQAGADAKAFKIVLHVDQEVTGSPKVSVTVDGEQEWPPKGKAKAVLDDDFEWEKGFRGSLNGLGVKDFYEVRPTHLATEHWYSATLTDQDAEDGSFKVLMKIPDPDGSSHVVEMPGVVAENVRDAEEKRTMSLAYQTVRLLVPQRHPLDASVFIDHVPVTHFFGRPTPPPSQGSKAGESRVKISVNKTRTLCKSDVTHHFLESFLLGQPSAVTQKSEKNLHSWTFELGPLATHTVEVKKVQDKLYSLTVDGEVLVEASSHDLESSQGSWDCKFLLHGHRCIDWEVFESDGHGGTLDSTAVVTQRTKNFHHGEVICFERDTSLVRAEFKLDGISFADLGTAIREKEGIRVELSPHELEASFNIHVPYKVHDDAELPATGFAIPLGATGAAPATSSSGLFGLFTCCS